MDTLQSKKVSVVVPNYNYAKFLKKRLKTILRQTYPIYELIILDDASKDESVKIIEKQLARIKKKYPELRVQFIKNEKNSGKVMMQWERGFEAATGEFVWIAEVDDSSRRNFLKEVMVGFEDPEVVLSYCESAIINGSGILIAPNFRWSRDKEKTGHFKNSYINDGVREVEEIMAVRCTIPNVSAAVFRKTPNIPYQKYFKMAEEFEQVGDWFFYVKLLKHGKISYNRKSLNVFRVHSGSRTDRTRKGGVHFREIMEMYKMFLADYNITDEVKQRMEREERRVRKKHGIIE